uniref:Heterogeneous nuclear ribonucleoprotein D0 (Trinotate prediction) n=1 Tax=Myxobolus squamalis TaxID=59785 RepID=A0A6B2FWW7_MYXSQ
MLLLVDLGSLSRFKNFSGFGFVMFKTIEEADTVLKTRPHMLDGKIIDPKKAVGITKTGLPVTKKIFVGGVRSETSDDLLREYFSQFGSVHSLDFPIDHVTNKRRGFCFLEFDEPEAAERAMSMNYHPIGNQTVEVKPAYTKEQQQALMAKGMWPPQSLNFLTFELSRWYETRTNAVIL